MIHGQRLKKLRHEKKISAEQLAAYLGVSRQQVVRYEAEQTDCSTETVIRLADFFNISTDYLLGRTDVPNSPRTSSGKILTWEIDVRKLLDRLSPETVAKFVKAMGIQVTVKNNMIDVQELLDQFSPGVVYNLLHEFDIDVTFVNFPKTDDRT